MPNIVQLFGRSLNWDNLNFEFDFKLNFFQNCIIENFIINWSYTNNSKYWRKVTFLKGLQIACCVVSLYIKLYFVGLSCNIPLRGWWTMSCIRFGFWPALSHLFLQICHRDSTNRSHSSSRKSQVTVNATCSHIMFHYLIICNISFKSYCCWCNHSAFLKFYRFSFRPFIVLKTKILTCPVCL